MRTSRSAWLARFFPAVFGGRKREKRTPREKAEPKFWVFPDGVTVRAFTKGEARAIVKRARALERLPAGTVIIEG